MKKRRVNKIILHCSATDYKNQRASWIDKIHREEFGFTMIGYHFFIRRDGLIQKGRPLWRRGQHTTDYNRYSIGICLPWLNVISVPALKSLENVLLPLLQLTYPKATLHGHCEFNKDKTCPNFDYSYLVDKWQAQLI